MYQNFTWGNIVLGTATISQPIPWATDLYKCKQETKTPQHTHIYNKFTHTQRVVIERGTAPWCFPTLPNKASFINIYIYRNEIKNNYNKKKNKKRKKRTRFIRRRKKSKELKSNVKIFYFSLKKNTHNSIVFQKEVNIGNFCYDVIRQITHILRACARL